MRTNKERTEVIKKRTAEIKAQQEKNRTTRFMVASIASVAACLCILTCAGLKMPQIIARFSVINISHSAGTASMLTDSDSLGYVIMAIFAFLLGCCVTTMLHVIHRRNQRQKKESGRDE
ncbi:MAG: hypothetical protein IKT31_02860 [Firmicutes bacterium]|nr:hypothetical protein [Bacillota bacterium]